MSSLTDPAFSWDTIRLVVFDVDGTLYDQRALRLRMLREMLVHAALRRSVGFIRILRAYRQIREQLGDELSDNFEHDLIVRTARAAGCSEESVRSTAREWLEQRPLRHLERYRFTQLREVFEGLRRREKKIGIFSDYPAREKLDALNLTADFVVCSTDKDVGVLKPQGKGLEILMARAGMSPAETILIGDRPERDGLAARAANVRSLILSRKPIDGFETFDRYGAPPFTVLSQPR